uniref:Uncharacterized protein n=2 Tax=Oryza brachyantha TaxID=4533 RepID=J3NF24_ORYBR
MAMHSCRPHHQAGSHVTAAADDLATLAAPAPRYTVDGGSAVLVVVDGGGSSVVRRQRQRETGSHQQRQVDLNLKL